MIKIILLWFIFSNVLADCIFCPPNIDQDMHWSNCQQLNAPIRSVFNQDEQIHLQSQSMQASISQKNIRLSGQVWVQKNAHQIYADQLIYDQRNQKIESPGPLQLEWPEIRLKGQKGWYDLDDHQGEIEGVEYRLFQPKARGRAAKVQLLDPQHIQYQNASYTTCPPQNHSFMLSAEQILIDQRAQIGTFYGAKLIFFDRPIFYWPKFSLSLDEKRKSGVLVPTLGYSSRNGLDITLPYYFNLAPNYDATLYPRLLSQRGLLLGGEFRYLRPHYQGKILAEILPDDRLYGDSRGSLHWNHSADFNGLEAHLEINWASDADYKQDLGHSLAVNSTRFLFNRAALEWHKPHWDISAETIYYQVLDESIAEQSRPYSLLPRLRWIGLNQTDFGLNYQWHTEYSVFYRDQRQYGRRLDIYPEISHHWQKDWLYIEPSAQIRYTHYRLGEGLDREGEIIDRWTYRFSLDSGLFFDRPVHWLGQSGRQSLEPRLFYAYIPYVNQDDIPLFDTGLMDFNFDRLFHANRFNGPDRIGDTNQLSIALTSRWFDQFGQEKIRFNLGQILYFDDRQVRLDTEPLDRSSDWLASLSGHFNDRWTLNTIVQYDPKRSDLNQALTQLQYHDQMTYLRAQWRQRKSLIDQTDLAAIFPFNQHTRLVGRWLYSRQNNRTLEALAGLEYNNCCWQFSGLIRRYWNGSQQDYDNSFYLQLQFKGLGKIGHRIDSILDRTVYD